jgi:uncharacterized damage-inducible protein DinB
MAWANQKVFSAVDALPADALKSYIVNEEWTAGEILHHICDSAGFYAYRLGVGPKKVEFTQSHEISDLRSAIAIHDANLISAAGLEDNELEWVRDGKTLKRWSSTILSQAVHHATEHRAQLMDALEFRGFVPISLDDLDLWSFDQFERDGAI